MDIIIPDIEHKYITLFETQQGYNAAAPNFIEVNWSAVKDTEHPEETPVPYQPSTRPTHGYEPVDNVDVFPDSSVRMLWYTYDHILKTFFLEILWGYYGWEWVDYEYTDPDTQETTTLAGGNLYKVKEITEVPSIPDGDRLYHINNFLNSQDKVNHVNWFYTGNLKSIRNAFARPSSSSVRNIQLDIYSFPEVTDAYQAFYLCNISIPGNETLQFPKVKVFDGTFYGIDISNITINAPALTTVSKLFSNCTKVFGSSNVFNLSDHLVSDFSTISDFKELLSQAYFDGNNEYSGFVINLNLTSSTPNNFDLTKAFQVNFKNTTVTSPSLTINLNINKPTVIESLCAGSGTRKVALTSNIQGTSYITNAKFAFSGLDLYSNIPYTQPLNADVDDTCIYYKTTFRNPVTYDFSPNQTPINTYSHFSDATFYDGFSFSNVDCLNRICFYSVATYGTVNDNVVQVPFDFSYDLGTSSSNYKIVDFSYSGLRTLGNHTIYSILGTTFKGCSNLAMDETYTFYSAGRKVSGLNNGGTITYTATHPTVDFEGTNLVSTPVIWLNFTNNSRSGALFTGPATLQKIILGKVPGSSYHPSCSLNMSATLFPNLVYLVLNTDMTVSTLNLTGQYNLDVQTLEQSLSIQTMNTLTVQQAMWDLLSTSCQNTCRENITTINLIQEHDE